MSLKDPYVENKSRKASHSPPGWRPLKTNKRWGDEESPTSPDAQQTPWPSSSTGRSPTASSWKSWESPAWKDKSNWKKDNDDNWDSDKYGWQGWKGHGAENSGWQDRDKD